MTEGVELRFWAAVHSIETGEERRLATFYVMNTSLNRNNWRVTDKALEDALATLLKKPLGCIPGYRVNHAHEPMRVGAWVRVEKPDGYALATAEITDDVAWEKLNSGEWGPVSVVIRAFRVTCSVCGGDITGAPDDHIESGEGHEVVESFVFDRVDFVGTPAYPQAGIVMIDELEGAQAARARMASYAPSYTQRSWSTLDGAQGPQGDLKPDEKEEKKRLEAQIEELRQQLEEAQAENDTLKAENESLKDVQAEKDELKGRVEALEAERHQERVDAALEARFKAGLVADREVEAERLKELDDDILVLLAEDAEKVAEKLAKVTPTGPKAKYTTDDKTAFEAAVEDTRERLFGHRREAEG